MSNIAFLLSSTPPHYSPCTPTKSVVYGYPPTSNMCPLFPDTAFLCLENALISSTTFNTLQALFEYPPLHSKVLLNHRKLSLLQNLKSLLAYSSKSHDVLQVFLFVCLYVSWYPDYLVKPLRKCLESTLLRKSFFNYSFLVFFAI